MADDEVIEIDIEQLKRENYFDLGRDDYMSLQEYLLSAQADNDLRSKRGKIKLSKKKAKKKAKKSTTKKVVHKDFRKGGMFYGSRKK